MDNRIVKLLLPVLFVVLNSFITDPPKVETLPDRMGGMPTICGEIAPVVRTKKDSLMEVFEKQVIPGIKEENIRAYVTQYYKTALEEYNVTPYRPSMKLAQAIIESGAGTSFLSAKRHAHFGIKAGWNSDLVAAVIVREDVIPCDVFNTYAKDSDSWRDHSHFMQLGRYRKAVKAATLEQACYELGVSGYATCQYKSGGKPGRQVYNTIKKYRLDILDEIVK